MLSSALAAGKESRGHPGTVSVSKVAVISSTGYHKEFRYSLSALTIVSLLSLARYCLSLGNIDQ